MQSHESIERLAAFLATLHPAWQHKRWEDMSEDTREQFREDARRAIAVYEDKHERT